MAVSESRRQHKKHKIFDESGLTDAERREIRTHQRSLQEQMRSGEIGWEQGRVENNEIFATKVAYSRELVIDVENSTIALSGFAKEVESKVQVSHHHTYIPFRFCRLGLSCLDSPASSVHKLIATT
jgi:hypothetical protein